MVGAGLLPRLRARFSADARIAAASVVFGLAMLVLGYVRFLPLLCLCLGLAGVAWMVVTSGLSVVVQGCVPKWVQARALGTFLLVFQGVLASTSLLWGLIANHLGNPPALVLAAAAMVIGVAATARWRLQSSEGLDLQPAQVLPDPEIEDPPDLEEGPVLVTAEYQLEPAHEGEFIHAMRELGRVRRRDGAIRWGLFRDPAQPGRFLESFVVESWAEHLRQVARATVADRAIDERARSFLRGSQEPNVTHLIAARAPDEEASCTSGV